MTPGWEGALPDNWPRWLVFRDAPQETRNIVLWARVDLFPGGIIDEVDETTDGIDEDLPVGSLPVK
jgi:hypothetical protein